MCSNAWVNFSTIVRDTFLYIEIINTWSYPFIYYLIQNSQAVKKVCGPQKGYGEKRCETNGTKFTWTVVIKIFTINLPSQPFLGRHLGFQIFVHHSLFEGRTLFLQLGCFGLDFTSFCICIPQSQPMACFGAFLTYRFFYEADVKYFKYFWIYQ